MKTNTLAQWLPMLLALMLISAVTPVQAISEVGGNCYNSGDCRIGYCAEETKTCVLPTKIVNFTIGGECKITANCVEGYCKDNECIIPTTAEYHQSVEFGVKSGCAGMIENCAGFWCDFCNLIWLLVIAGAAIAGLLAKRQSILLAVAMIILPIIFALILLPVLGFLVSLLEIFILFISGERMVISRIKMPELKLPLPPAPELPKLEAPKLPELPIPPAPELPQIPSPKE